MKLWLDAQLSPALAPLLEEVFDIKVLAVQADPALVSASDDEIFKAAGGAKAVVMTKARDFVELLNRHGPPPQVLWVTLGNTSNAAMREVLETVQPKALEQLRSGESLVEISRGR
jgi:predicted nuclease of predicted toxin-antitoxin system